jgi:hypothetical protein|tara:strand:+ start:711 stop:1133 length:423 start_codon:yes stop_codon:yes gene_type:complete
MIPVITSLLSLGGTWLEGKQKETEATLQAKLVEIKADSDIKVAKATALTKMAEAGQTQNYDLDRLAMEQMTKSWKDEFILIIFLAPMIMAFIPGLKDYSLDGFSVVALMPEWYRYIIIGMVVVIYGLRGLLEKALEKKFK